jgi:predicted nucleic acid-binding protein
MYLIDTNVWLELKQIPRAQQQYQLDFDDAYQYVAAEQSGYVLVSFDHDFDHTALGRETPAQIVNE